ncbi:peroxidase 11-like, partial [Trifolium medium]|nr:peroxidase 11-like [Trifolium medium]
KDSVTASFELANTNLPTPDESLVSIIPKFFYQGLSVTDMVLRWTTLISDTKVLNCGCGRGNGCDYCECGHCGRCNANAAVAA